MYLIWNNNKFISKKEIDIKEDILGGKLITIPAAPALIENKNNYHYQNALRNSSFSIIDSGLFAILCRISGYKVYRYSGYKLIFDLIKYLKTSKIKIFFISPTEGEKSNILKFLIDNTLLDENNIDFYVAPFYPKNSEINDYILLNIIEKFNPEIVLICIAGGKQEVLGDFLKVNLSIKSSILCTGAAISFFTGSQVKISPIVDKLYLGWLARIISNPKIFIPRYFNSLRFLFEFFKYKIKIIN